MKGVVEIFAREHPLYGFLVLEWEGETQEVIPSGNGPRARALIEYVLTHGLPHAYIEIESVTVSERSPE